MPAKSRPHWGGRMGPLWQHEHFRWTAAYRSGQSSQLPGLHDLLLLMSSALKGVNTITEYTFSQIMHVILMKQPPKPGFLEKRILSLYLGCPKFSSSKHCNCFCTSEYYWRWLKFVIGVSKLMFLLWPNSIFLLIIVIKINVLNIIAKLDAHKTCFRFFKELVSFRIFIQSKNIFTVSITQTKET